MTKHLSRLTPLATGLLILVAGCQDQMMSPDSAELEGPLFAKSKGKAESSFAQIVEYVDAINARFEAAGQSIRLDYPRLFTVGWGTDPFARLRTGGRWPYQDVHYILDESDYTADVPDTEVDAALESAFDTWSQVANTNIELVRDPDPGGNFDVIDGMYDAAGNCVFGYDLTSPNIDWDAGFIYPESDIVVGGWVNPNYFSQCLGSPDIIGVTWYWFVPDQNGDQYPDYAYVEQFYNPAFYWVTSGSTFLDEGSGIDIQTIVVHEDGHALGLDHFGGPVRNQPFMLHPNGRVFNPTAVMNPYYLGGERRELQHTDIAALRTLYSRGN